MREIGGRRLPDASGEPRSERRPGKAARPGQLLQCPVVAGVAMDSAQGRPDLRVERTGQPVRFGVRASGPGAKNLDEDQIEDPGYHHRRSLRGRLHLEEEHPAGHLEPFERRAAGAAQDDRGREAGEQVARLRVADRERSAEPARRLGCGRVVPGCAGRTGTCARWPASLMWCGSPRGSRMTSPRPTRSAFASPSIQSTSSPSSTMCRVPIPAKLVEKVRCGAYATIRSPLRRTLRSSSESKSCGWPDEPRPSAASSKAGGSANSPGGRSKSAGVAGRSARYSGGAVIVPAHSSDYAR